MSPQNVLWRNNLALYAMYAGEYDTAIQESREILKLNPKFGKALLCIALAQVGQGRVSEAGGTWSDLAGLGGEENQSMAALGLADLAEFEGRYSDAVSILEHNLSAPELNHDKEAAAIRQVALAEAYLHRGLKPKARAVAENAAASSTDPAVVFPAAAVLIETGGEAKAKKLADQLGTRWEPEPQAYAHLIDGLVRLHVKDYRAAVASFRSAKSLSDTWMGRLLLGTAYLEAGAFAEADTEFDACVRRRGESSAVFLDDNPTVRYYPPAEYYLGRARLALENTSGAYNLNSFLQIKVRSEADPMIADARKRLEKK
jgi:tetratricopeptide (TPR) repeat protein